MPDTETHDEPRRQLAAWYAESLRPRVMRAVKDGRVSVGSARALEDHLRELFAPRAPAVQRIVNDRRNRRTP